MDIEQAKRDVLNGTFGVESAKRLIYRIQEDAAVLADFKDALAKSELSRTVLIKQNQALAVENERLEAQCNSALESFQQSVKGGETLVNMWAKRCNEYLARCESLEAVIKAAKEQEPVAYQQMVDHEWVPISKARHCDLSRNPRKMLRKLYADPVPAQSPAVRITEQDAREIIESFNNWWSRPNPKVPGIITDHAAQVVPVYLDDEGRTLLNKLNADREQSPAEVHTDDLAVDRFAHLMKQKLAKSRDKGRGGWDNPLLCKVNDLAKMLVDHISKGDPVDVANFAMMLTFREGGYDALKVAHKPAVAVQDLAAFALICDQEAAEWDSDKVITEKNYAAACAARIRAMLEANPSHDRCPSHERTPEEIRAILTFESSDRDLWEEDRLPSHAPTTHLCTKCGFSGGTIEHAGCNYDALPISEPTNDQLATLKAHGLCEPVPESEDGPS